MRKIILGSYSMLWIYPNCLYLAEKAKFFCYADIVGVTNYGAILPSTSICVRNMHIGKWHACFFLSSPTAMLRKIYIGRDVETWISDTNIHITNVYKAEDNLNFRRTSITKDKVGGLGVDSMWNIMLQILIFSFFILILYLFLFL